MIDTPKDLTVQEVAEHLRVDQQTVWRWLKKGNLQGYKLPGKGFWRIPSSEMERLKGRHGPP